MLYFRNYTLYSGPLLTVSDRGYTKHYFMEGERIASTIGGSGTLLENPYLYTGSDLSVESFINFVDYYFVDHSPSSFEKPGMWIGSSLVSSFENAVHGYEEDIAYFYHVDHLGSGTLISDSYGEAYQLLGYLPYGEVLFDFRSNIYDGTPYLFNGKELDEESGNYYYHSRYQNPILGVFISPDELSHLKPWLTSYHYCSNNPVNRVDRDGRFDTELGAWIHKIRNGGGSKIQKNAKGQYFYTKGHEGGGQSMVYGKHGYHGKVIHKEKELLNGEPQVSNYSNWAKPNTPIIRWIWAILQKI